MNKQKVFTITTGNVDIFRKESREAAKFISSIEGFIAVHPHYPDGTLWCFDTLNHAKVARNKVKSKGAQVGTHIMNAEIDYDKGELFVYDKAD